MIPVQCQRSHWSASVEENRQSPDNQFKSNPQQLHPINNCQLSARSEFTHCYKPEVWTCCPHTRMHSSSGLLSSRDSRT